MANAPVSRKVGKPFKSAKYEEIESLQEIVQIFQKGDKYTATTKEISLPLGPLFKQLNCSASWEEIKNGHKVIICLEPVFYNFKKAWLLSEIYGICDEPRDEEKAPPSNDKIISYKKGLKIFNSRS